MNKYIKAILISFMLLVSAQSFAGTYDGSYYTDQQRLTMVDDYLKQLASGMTATGGTIESINKYSDTRLLNGKKGYIGSVLITRPDSYINTINTTASGFSASKQVVVHLFDNTSVGVFNVASGTADCRSFTNPSRTQCFGDNATKNLGLIGFLEIKKDNPFNSTVSIGTQYTQEKMQLAKYYTYFKQTSGTSREVLTFASPTTFNDVTVEMGLIYNSLQNSDGSWPTVAVETPPMDIGVAIPTPLPITVAPVVTQDCSNPDASNTTNSSICLIGQVIEGCKLTTGNYNTTINSVAGNVGLTAVDVKITCSTGLPFHIKPIHDKIDLAGTDETLRLTGWKDSGRGDKLTPLSAKVMNGTGTEQSIPIYFTLEGKGKSGLYGNSVVNKYNGTTVYPIQIVY